MSTVICPDCQASLDVFDPANPPARCPQCGAGLGSLAAGIAAGLPPDVRPVRRNDIDDDEHRPPTRRWTTTILGVKFMFWSMVVGALMQTLTQAVQIAMPLSPEQPPNLMHPALLVNSLAGCVLFFVAILFFVGLGMCCTAPDTVSRRSALISVGSMLLGLALAMVVGILAFVRIMPEIQRKQLAGQQPDPNALFKAIVDAGPGMLALAGVTVVVLLVGYFSWLYFHAAVANAFQNPSLRRLAILNLATWPFLIAIGMAVAFAPAKTFGVDETTKLRIQAAAALVITLIEYGLYLPLAFGTFKTIERGAT